MKQVLNSKAAFTASIFCKTIAFICLFALPLGVFAQKHAKKDVIGRWVFYDFVANHQFHLECYNCDSIQQTQLSRVYETALVTETELLVDSFRRAFALSYLSFDKNGDYYSCIQGKFNSSAYKIRRKSGIIFKNDITTMQMKTVKKDEKTHRFIVISTNHPIVQSMKDDGGKYITVSKAEFWFSFSDDNLKRNKSKDAIHIAPL